jgi:hypothetical protein
VKHVLAITFDGVLQPIGYSQVARVVIGLARRGVPYALVSMERERDLADRAHVARVRARLDEAGVPWQPAPFAEGGGGGAMALNVARAFVAAARTARRVSPGVVHARAFAGAVVARALRVVHRCPYLLDVRAYWIDEQVEEGRRFRAPGAYRAAKALERDLVASAAGFVTLTALQADDVRSGVLGPPRGQPIEVIPPCADYDEFTLDAAPPPELARFAGEAPLVAIIGALNRSYLLAESVRLARLVLARSAAKLVVLSAQAAAWGAVLDAGGVPRDRVLLTSVRHDRMPQWMPHLGSAILLLRSPFAKRASMPTKLAEFFASGVRPLQHGCNSEVSAWVRRAGSGLVLDDVSEPALEAAADVVASGAPDRAALRRAREATRGHFSLESGLDRYQRILERIG